MRSPSNAEEENVFTNAVNKYLDGREKIFNEKIKALTWFIWIAVLFCISLFVLCYIGVSSIIRQNNNYAEFIEHEIKMSERRDARETKKAILDSMAVQRYLKNMEHWEKTPDFKGERK
jgi:hypothetical protein